MSRTIFFVWSPQKTKGLCKYTTSLLSVHPSISPDYFCPHQPISLNLSNKETDRSLQSNNTFVSFPLKKSNSKGERSPISTCRRTGTQQLYIVLQQHVGQLVPAASYVRASSNSWWRQAEESQNCLRQRTQSVIKSSHLHSAVQRKKAALKNKIAMQLRKPSITLWLFKPSLCQAFCPIAFKKLS